MDKYLFVGKSGSGKSTLAFILERRNAYEVLKSHTDRDCRGENDKDHTFDTKEEFDKIPKEDMIAYTEFNGHRYCATKQQLDEADIYIIDPKGVADLKTKYDFEHNNVKILYFKCSAIRRFFRMIKRGDTIKQAFSRIVHDHKAFKNLYKQMGNYYVVNANRSIEDVFIDFFLWNNYHNN